MPKEFCERVGRNIKKYRTLSDMTLKELADKLELTESTIQKYEAGNIKTVNAEMLNQIADILNVAPEKLTEWESRADYRAYRKEKQGEDEAQLIKMYSQLTTGHKRAVRCLIKELLACQEK